jgi:hypothetical protein
MAVRGAGLLSVAALALVACANPPVPSGSIAMDAPARRIVVAPLNLAIRTPSELVGKGEPVWHQLLGHFQALDKQVAVISPISAERLWLEARLDLDLSDRSRALATARSRFAKALAGHRPYDLLVIPSLVLRSARMQGIYAHWDDSRRVVPGGSVMIDTSAVGFFQPHGSMEVPGLRGKVAAASLHVAVLRSDGTALYEGLGGLDLIQQVSRDDRRAGGWKYELRPEPFGDDDNLREGVERAFAAAPASHRFSTGSLASLPSEPVTRPAAVSGVSSTLAHLDDARP